VRGGGRRRGNGNQGSVVLTIVGSVSFGLAVRMRKPVNATCIECLSSASVRLQGSACVHGVDGLGARSGMNERVRLIVIGMNERVCLIVLT